MFCGPAEVLDLRKFASCLPFFISLSEIETKKNYYFNEKGEDGRLWRACIVIISE